MYRVIGSDQKEYGPISVEQIREWLDQGRVNRQTPVRNEDASEWKPLGAVTEFQEFLAASAMPPPVMVPSASASSGGGINVIIPYKNLFALIGYYLAVFSLIPFIGMVLGLAAFGLGILGLRFRRKHPTAGGSVHAWIGIILGGLCGFGYLALTILTITAISKRH
jgi:GYF domain 2